MGSVELHHGTFFEDTVPFLLAITALPGKLRQNSTSKQSHSAIRYNTDAVSREASKWPIFITA